MIFSETDAERCDVMIEPIRKAVTAANWPLRTVTISVGASTWTSEMAAASQMISLDDQALYCAKASGRNFVRHSRMTCCVLPKEPAA